MKKTCISFCFLIYASTLFSQQLPVSTGRYHFEPSKTNNTIKFKATQKYKHSFYVDAIAGSDENEGTSAGKAFKTLDKLSTIKIGFGDQVLLKGGLTYKGCISLANLNENTGMNGNEARIHIGSYGGSKATIDCAGYKAGIWIENSSFIDITDLKITGNGGVQSDDIKQRYGIRIESNKKIKNSLLSNIMISNVDIYDVFLLNPVTESRACNQWGMKDADGWGWGIFGASIGGKGIHNVVLKEIDVRNVSEMGIRFLGGGSIDGSADKNCNNIQIEKCNIFQSGGPGMQFNKCNNSSMKYCRITESGNRNDNRKWGRGSGMWTWGCSDFLLDHNIFEGAQGIGDCCGAHIDYNCNNVIIQNSVSRYNAGGFIEILGLNHNCSYRYNVSINDGWRNISDTAQKFWGKVASLGCILTVNGYNDKKEYRGPYQSYIYNNTVINTTNEPYTNPFVFNISTSNVGLVVMNNIFWTAQKCKADYSMHRFKDGKPFEAANDFMIAYEAKDDEVDKNGAVGAKVRNMNEQELAAMNIVMKNNIYKMDMLPLNYKDEHPIYENPGFANVDGYDPAAFIPSNTDLINKGMVIPKLATDKTDYGLKFGGLNITTDFFGNTIKGSIIGAIVPNAKPAKTTSYTVN